MRIAVVGASGVLGRALVPLLLQRGHRIQALVRSPQASGLLPHENLAIVQADILQAQSLVAPLADCDVVMHIATAIPRAGTASDWSRNDAVRTAGTENLLKAAATADLYIQQSIVMFYADGGAQWITEDSLIRPRPDTASAQVMEQKVRQSASNWIILRGGVFYGPGTGRMAEWNRLAAAGRLRLPGDGSGYISLIHVEDFASAFVAALDARERRLTLNIVDDQPVTYDELFRFVADLHGGPPPSSDGPAVFPSLRISNGRAKLRLGWVPRFPDYRAGWSRASSAPEAHVQGSG